MSTTTVGDIDVYYEEHGSGKPLLLIMGLAVDSTGWLYQVPAFAEQRRTIVFDNRGIGRTSKPSGPYSIAQMADDASGLLDALGIERADVVGISMGGMIAQELALRHPSRVGSLVLACTYAEPNEEIQASRVSAMSQLGGSIDADGKAQIDASSFDPMMLLQTLLPKVFTPTFIGTELPKVMEMFTGALQWGFSIEAIMAQSEAALAHRTTDRLAEIKARTLVITGDADQLITPTHSDVLADKIPHAELVRLPGGSHAFNFETPELFNKTVLAFLAKASA